MMTHMTSQEGIPWKGERMRGGSGKYLVDREGRFPPAEQAGGMSDAGIKKEDHENGREI